MQIFGKITGISYSPTLCKELKEYPIKEFDINDAKTSCYVSDRKLKVAISKWVSPKRTRSYPYERVYNTLSFTKKITVIPVIKDEGINGDRDYIQWDTIALMSLLDVYVILAYYDKASRNSKNKLTKQKFNNDYIHKKIKEIKNYHSSALHWNLKEIDDSLSDLLIKAKNSYREISKSTNVQIHSLDGIDNLLEKLNNEVETFKQFSREKARNAQEREVITVQPKEKLSSLTKASIVISNYLGGEYYFTVDEVEVNEKISLIEKKHSKSSKLPSISDIKDGLLKMMLFSNLSNVTVDGINIDHFPILFLSSDKISGKISSNDTKESIELFVTNNSFSPAERSLLSKVFFEAQSNNFSIIVSGS